MKRIGYLDLARATGMFLVYYGHFVEKAVLIRSQAMFSEQWRFIYSFHMPLFFFLAGIFWKPSPDLKTAIQLIIRTRIIPAVFFSLMLLPIWLGFFPGQLLEKFTAPSFLRVIPKLNVVTWFLICLAMVELLTALVNRYLKMTHVHLIIYSVISVLLGYYALIGYANRMTAWFGVHPNVLYLDNALMAMPFYFAGHLFQKAAYLLEGRRGWMVSVVVSFTAGYILLQTYDLNAGEKFWGVLMAASKYGQLKFFLINAFLGILLTITLSRVLYLDFYPVEFVSRNSLIYMGLNGLCYHFLNSFIIKHLDIPINSHGVLTLYAAAVSLATMILFSPMVIALQRWLPELAGGKWNDTSLLPSMELWAKNRFISWTRNQLQKYIFN